MRRFSLYVTLLLTFLIPLHAAASVWLLAPVCPGETAMVDAMDHGVHDASENIVSEEVVPDCCDEMDEMDCLEMQTCHGCNMSFLIFPLSIPLFTFLPNASVHASMNTPALGLFDPASVWRPPTNS